jgi:hypothetical protein
MRVMKQKNWLASNAISAKVAFVVSSAEKNHFSLLALTVRTI